MSTSDVPVLFERADRLIQEIGRFLEEASVGEEESNSEGITPETSQLTIVSKPAISIMPPTILPATTKEELEAVRRSSHNVYAPYMPNLIKLSSSNFSKDYVSHDGQRAVFVQDRELTDFTVQADIDLSNRYYQEAAGFVFRFSNQTSEGYRFSVYYHDMTHEQGFNVDKFRTRSELTGEPLLNIDYRGRLITLPYNSRSISESGFYYYDYSHAVIGLVAQKKTLDLYINLIHVVRVDTATLLQGKFGFIDENSKSFDMRLLNNIRVWAP